MQRNLDKIVFEENNGSSFAEAAVHIVLETFGQLREWVKTHHFENKQQEIEFFKFIKPTFSSNLIYFNEMFRIETE